MQISGPGRGHIDGLGSAWSEVAAFTSAVDAGLGRWLLDAYRVGLTEYRALEHLARESDKELRVNDLAQRVGLNQSSATRLVSRLEVKGLTRRDICAADGRGVYAVITEAGEALVRDVRGPYGKRIDELLGEVAAQSPRLDAQRLGRILSEIGSRIGDR